MRTGVAEAVAGIEVLGSGARSAGAPLGTIAILDRLVGFDTISSHSNLALVEWVRGYLLSLGVESQIETSPDGTKANLYARIGPAVAGGVALSGHTDTVPVEGQAWSADPFTMRRQDGRLIGRGTADMKGFVASCLAAVPRFQSASLNRPIHLCLTYDEEVGCHGARQLLAGLATDPLRPGMVIVGEPSRLAPIVAHKGKLSVDGLAIGIPGHSSEPDKGVNAVVAAAEVVLFLKSQGERLRREGPLDAGFDPPCTTAHVGVLQGGQALNMIPDRASFVFEWRHVPAQDPYALLDELRAYAAQAIEPWMKAISADAGLRFSVRAELPGMELDPEDPLVALVRSCSGSNLPTAKVAYGTEGGLYQRSGIRAVICGPGDIAQAHQPDEWIAESELHACDRFLDRLAAGLSA